ncbi:hypothetical protein G9A89_019282 [Geosiphon pyriformis]|nr:hypothetical protein G9A89_019282 [Geosiphon pyriformis]
MCHKWDVMVRKGLRIKASLPRDFPSKVLYYSFLYGLKPFKQVQSKEKMALLISFSNGCSIIGHLFDHRFLDLQSDCIEIYMDEFLRYADSAKVVSRMAAYFLAANAGIGVRVTGFLFSTLTKLQAVALALECAGLDFDIIPDIIIKKIDWGAIATVWHPDSHMLSGFTSRKSANLRMYLMKAVYRRLPVAVRKRLYNKDYSGVLCLLCGEVELSDHVFTYFGDFGLCEDILVKAAKKWISMSGLLCLSASAILFLLLLCSSDANLYTAVCKDFVMKHWYVEAVSVFEEKKEAALALVKYIRAKHRVNMEKTGLVRDNGLVSDLSGGIVSKLLAEVIHMLGVIESFVIGFGRHKLCHFFSGLGGDAFVNIGGQSYFISRSPDSGRYLCFALVMFGSQANLDLVVANTDMLRKCIFGGKLLIVDIVFGVKKQASKVFKSHFVGSLSYAKASAPPIISEFPPLVAFVSPVTVFDPAVGSRLNSLKKQISNLAALVKSIVEPVGSLVALVPRLLDDNAIKTV